MRFKKIADDLSEEKLLRRLNVCKRMFGWLLPSVILQGGVKISNLEPGPTQFLRAEWVDDRSSNDYHHAFGQVLKLTFKGRETGGVPVAGLVGIVDRIFAAPDRTAIHSPDEFAFLIPSNYPPDLSSLKLRLNLGTNDLSQSKLNSVWEIDHLPQTAIELPPIKTECTTPELKVSGRAKRLSENFQLSLEPEPPLPGGGWSLHLSSGTPFRQFKAFQINTWESEQKIEQAPIQALLEGSTYDIFADRILVDGSFIHYQSFAEEFDLPAVEAIPNPRSDLKSTEHWHLVRGTAFVSPNGVKGNVGGPNGGYGYSGPLPKRDLHLGIELNFASLANGLEPILARLKKKSPDRTDIYIAPVTGEKDELNRWTNLEGIDSSKDDPSSLMHHIVVGIFNDQVSSCVRFRLRLVRRIADQTIPFSLVLPLLGARSAKSAEAGQSSRP